MPVTSPLLITTNDALADEVTRLAAVAGCEPRRLADPVQAGERWRTAALVLLDGAAAASAGPAGLPARPGLCVISSESEPDFWRVAFELGAQHAVELPADEAVLIDLLAEQRDGAAARVGRVLAVIGGCGGAGASVLATGTALTSARRGDHCLLLDCDPLGGGLDLAVGTEESEGLRWSGLNVSGGRVAAGALRDALPGRKIGSGTLAVLSCDRDGPPAGLTVQAVRSVVAAARRAGETVVCDLPRALPDPAGAALRMADLTLLVVPAEVRACAAAARLAGEVKDRAAGPVWAVVRGPAPGGLTPADVGTAVGVDVLAVLRSQPAVASAVDRSGLCPGRAAARGPMARVARDILAVLDATGERPNTGETE